jgi:mono/diheme cytochrome c family protein
MKVRILKKLAFGLLGLLVVGFLVIQAVPYGRAHANPAVVSEPNWDTPRTRQLAKQACFACHSNETAWPWYSNVAPISWWVQDHVDEGREELNFSVWNTGEDSDDVYESVVEGEMPPWYYRPWDSLSTGEMDELLFGLKATFPSDGESNGGGDGGHDDD